MAFPLLPLLGNLAASVVSSYLGGGALGDAAGAMTGNAIKGKNVGAGVWKDDVENSVKQSNEQTKEAINTKPAFAQAITPYIQQQQPQQDPVALAFNTLYKPYGRRGGYG